MPTDCDRLARRAICAWQACTGRSCSGCLRRPSARPHAGFRFLDLSETWPGLACAHSPGGGVGTGGASTHASAVIASASDEAIPVGSRMCQTRPTDVGPLFPDNDKISHSSLMTRWANFRLMHRSKWHRSYSITSSARARTFGGISRPSASAVLRFTTSSNRVGCSIGRSPGLEPVSILSTYEAARRHIAVLLAP